MMALVENMLALVGYMAAWMERKHQAVVEDKLAYS